MTYKLSYLVAYVLCVILVAVFYFISSYNQLGTSIFNIS